MIAVASTLSCNSLSELHVKYFSRMHLQATAIYMTVKVTTWCSRLQRPGQPGQTIVVNWACWAPWWILHWENYRCLTGKDRSADCLPQECPSVCRQLRRKQGDSRLPAGQRKTTSAGRTAQSTRAHRQDRGAMRPAGHCLSRSSWVSEWVVS